MSLWGLGFKGFGLGFLGFRSPPLFRKDCDFCVEGASWYFGGR